MRKSIPLLGLLFFALAWQGSAQTANRWANARWVWDEPDANKNAQSNEPRYLRVRFELSAKPHAANLWITADNVYIAYVNGVKVGQDSEWSSVEKYDVAKHLVIGKNVLAIKATNQGGAAGAIARLHVKTADKKDVFVVTDDHTKIRRAEPRERPVEGWTNPDFDDSAWFNAVVLGDTSIGPWNLSNSPVANAPGTPGKGMNYGSNAVDPKIKKRLSAQEQAKHFIVPKDFAIELVAADPLVINPITMVLDDKGRIIVSESHTYRYGPPGSPIKPYANPVIRLDPDSNGGFKRTLIADGFADPVMGIAVKGEKLWLTANNYLYTYDLPEKTGDKKKASIEKGKVRSAKSEERSADADDFRTSLFALRTLSLNSQEAGKENKPKPIAINKAVLLTDKNKAWNPFGMFVLEWGPDGKLYMSVGNHGINIVNNQGETITSRGGSGLVMRMNPDGSKMERLVHGLRVPYSFEMDPFGQLWLLSNGEGNPNRFVRVIEGVDYHCYSRPVPNDWLAGNNPLAPPCEEVHGGAHTQFMRYYAAAYPQEYWGNLFACNWGRHGFAGANRGIFRFILDDRNNIVKKETLVTCTDPHFRPAHIVLDTDGSLLIADWYGRDDESDMTGRIWRLKYKGKDKPVVKHKLDAAEWKNDDYAIEALGSPHHLVREKAMTEVLKRNPGKMLDNINHQLPDANPLGAANSLWALWRIDPTKFMPHPHPDWKVRRLVIDLEKRSNPDGGASTGFINAMSGNEKDPAILVHGVIGPEASRFLISLKLREALKRGAAADQHLRYEAAWLLAKHATLPMSEAFTDLFEDKDANIRLAGLIAIDVACYENFPSKQLALKALAKALENPGKLDQQLLLTVAQLDGDASIVPALEKMLSRDDLPTATIAKAYLVLKSKAGPSLALRAQGVGKRLVEAVEKGQLKIASPADQLVLFEFLEAQGPTPFALKQVAGQLRSPNRELKAAAHSLARRFGSKASPIAEQLWPSVLNPKTKFDDTIEYLSTIARVEPKPKQAAWQSLLKHQDPLVREEAGRWWRTFKDVPSIGEREPQLPKDELTRYAQTELTKMPKADRSKRAAMGKQVFERNACTKCHTTATATTLLAPSLKGVAQQKIDYLIESVLFPSKIIKTGWEVENIELKNGKTLVGLVKDDGKHLRVLNLDKDERVLKTDIEARATSKISVMPEGQEATLSRREFVDLIAYLQTLK